MLSNVFFSVGNNLKRESESNQRKTFDLRLRSVFGNLVPHCEANAKTFRKILAMYSFFFCKGSCIHCERITRRLDDSAAEKTVTIEKRC